MTSRTGKHVWDNRPPPFRRLRVYAFDPRMTVTLDRAARNELTLNVPWEELTPGPAGEYVEVIDCDPASQSFYRPVDLNDPALLMEDGLPPAEGLPQFHHQMVYALTMIVIRRFEQALGRVVLWSPHHQMTAGQARPTFVQRLRVYPTRCEGKTHTIARQRRP